MLKLHVFKNEKETCRSFASWFAEQVTGTLKTNEYFTLALSVEDIPRLFYKTLAAEYADTIDWNKIHVFKTDQIILPDTNNLNKADGAAKALFDNISIPKSNIHVIKTHISPEESASQYDELLHTYFSNSQITFNLVILGMDADGKSPFLFQGNIENDTSNAWAIPTYGKEAGNSAVTLTSAIINAAQETAFLVTGKDKQDAVQYALKGKYDPEKAPAQLIQTTNKPVHWFLDEGAAGKLIRVTP